MPNCCPQGSLPKGIIILVIFVLIILEYLFGSITESTNYVFNSTRFQIATEKQMHSSSPLLKLLLNKSSKNGSNDTYKILVNAQNTEVYISQNVSTNVYDYVNNSINSTDEALTSKRGLLASSTTLKHLVNSTSLPLCPEDPPYLLGKVEVVKNPVPSVQQLVKRFSWLKPGGHWKPNNCLVPKKVAIIIPFRCRGEHLLLFLQHMHPFLKRQQLDYTIFIIEQEDGTPFNRAMLMNIGFKEALKRRNYDCFIFHDVDLLPENDRNIYNCPQQPRHMSVAVDCLRYRLPYPAIFGGVSALTKEHFELLNGFSNSFWGWGGEDDDMSNRIKYHHLFISRYPPTIARYTMLTHEKNKPSPNRYDNLKAGQKKFDNDGLNNLKYKVVQSKNHLLYTWILVALDRPS